MRDRKFILLVAYVTIIIVWYLGRVISGDQTIIVLGLDYLGVWLFVPLLIFIPWALLKRSRDGVILLILPVMLFIWYYGPMFVPQGGIQGNSQQTFSIMSFNYRESNDDVQAFLQILELNPAEVLALQEVSGLTEEYLNKFLFDRYPDHVYNRSTGLAVYSRFSILEYQVDTAPPHSFQSLILDIEDSPVHLINAHLAKAGFLEFFQTGDLARIKDSAKERAGQITRIMEVIADKGIPAIIACDCNMTNLTRTYTQVTSKLQDAFITCGWGFGHTFLIPRGFGINSRINLPFQRIDYFFYSGELSVQSIEVISTESGSDHRPILAQFDRR